MLLSGLLGSNPYPNSQSRNQLHLLASVDSEASQMVSHSGILAMVNTVGFKLKELKPASSENSCDVTSHVPSTLPNELVVLATSP